MATDSKTDSQAEPTEWHKVFRECFSHFDALRDDGSFDRLPNTKDIKTWVAANYPHNNQKTLQSMLPASGYYKNHTLGGYEYTGKKRTKDTAVRRRPSYQKLEAEIASGSEVGNCILQFLQLGLNGKAMKMNLVNSIFAHNFSCGAVVNKKKWIYDPSEDPSRKNFTKRNLKGLKHPFMIKQINNTVILHRAFHIWFNKFVSF